MAGPVPRGADLDYSSVEIPASATRSDYADESIPDDARVGDLLDTDGGTVLLLADGPALLDPFAAAVYEHLDTPTGFHEPLPAPGFPGREFESPPLEDAHWPTELLTALDGPAQPCAQLLTASGAAPLAQLTQAPGDDASAVGLGPDTKAGTVDPGRGAVRPVRCPSKHDLGAPYVIDGKGRPTRSAAPARPQRSGTTAILRGGSPGQLIALFEDGVDLSRTPRCARREHLVRLTRAVVVAALARSSWCRSPRPRPPGPTAPARAVGRPWSRSSGPSEPLRQLGIDDVQDRVPALGLRKNVAVVDSGVRRPRLDVLVSKSFTGSSELLDPHGTAVAGVIARPGPGGPAGRHRAPSQPSSPAPA